MVPSSGTSATFSSHCQDPELGVWTQAGFSITLHQKQSESLPSPLPTDSFTNWVKFELLYPQSRQRLQQCPGQPIPITDNPFNEENFLNIPWKPPLHNLRPFPLCPVTLVWEKRWTPNSLQPFRHLQRVRRFPWPSFSPGWAHPTPYQTCVPESLWSLCTVTEEWQENSSET